jgi:hypothetical protein
MILYNLGDSHTCYNIRDEHASNGTWCPNLEDHYWYKIAVLYGCKQIINESMPGRSNDTMIKLAIKHCLENPKLSTLYIVNITTIFRFDLTTPHSHTLHNILTQKAIQELDFETIECTLYAHLIGLIEFFKSHNKQFLIINNGKNFSDNQLPMRDVYIEYFKKEPRILNWFDNGRIWFQENVTKIKPVDFAQYGWNGHDGPAGHQRYFDMLANKLKHHNLIKIL